MNKTQQPNLRLTLIFFFFIGLYFFLLLNLYHVQIHKSDFFVQRGQKQYEMITTVTPPRAEIYDRTNKRLLALNKEAVAAFVIPSKITQKELLFPFLEKKYPRALSRLKKQSKSHFLFIKRRLSKKEIAVIEQLGCDDIKLLKEPSRYYPIAGVGPLVGITDIDNQGLFGIEKVYNSTLAGTPSTYILEKDCRNKNFYISRETKVKGTKETPITLTIDGMLQFLIHEELKDHVIQMGAKVGSVLICEPQSGDILTMVNYPDNDPNTTEDLVLEHTKNRCIADAYELGSIMKVFLALAALEEKVVTQNELIDCENKRTTRINGMAVTTTRANGLVSFDEVIRYSNNIGVAKVAHRLGTKLYDHYTLLGFGKKTGLFPGEAPGSITPPHKWSRSSLTSLSFGYELSANLVQVAQALSIVANDGKRVPLHLIKSDEAPASSDALYSQETVNQIRFILQKTVDQGAARKARINGYTVMGKTGTARLLTNGRYDPHRHIFSFIAIVEKESYQRVVIVCIKETTKKGYLASQVAVPLFERVAHKMLIHDKII